MVAAVSGQGKGQLGQPQAAGAQRVNGFAVKAAGKKEQADEVPRDRLARRTRREGLGQGRRIARPAALRLPLVVEILQRHFLPGVGGQAECLDDLVDAGVALAEHVVPIDAGIGNQLAQRIAPALPMDESHPLGKVPLRICQQAKEIELVHPFAGVE